MNDRFTNILIKIFFISLFLTEIGTYFNNKIITLSSFLSAASFLVIYAMTFKNIKKNNLLNSILTVFIIVSVYSIKFYTKSIIDIRNLFFITTTSFALIGVTQLQFNLSKHKTLKLLFYLMTLFLFIGSKNINNYSLAYNNSLILGYSNPNVLSSVVLTHVIYLAMMISNKKIIKIIDMLFIAINIYLIFLTQSRTALLASMLVVIYIMFKKIISVKLINIIAKISIILPALFIAFNNTINNLMSKLSIFVNYNKPQNLNGRSRIWENQLSYITNETSLIFLGVNSRDNSAIQQNSHNYLLFIFFHNGILILINYIYLLYYAIYNKCKDLTDLNISSLFFWIIIVIANSFESHLATGLISFSLSWILLLSDIKN